VSGFFADQAAGFASTNRVEHADRLLDVACQEAIWILRIGRVHGDEWAGRDARLVLAKAQSRAGRVLGSEQVAS
jgi:hypothetical protein